MLVLTRTTNILLLPAIAVACAALEGLSVRRMVSLTLLLGSLALPGWLVQVALNSWFAGALTLSSYGTFGKFQFSLHYVSDIFVSYERGLFSYYPGFALMFGVALLVSRTRTAMAMICAGALGAAVLYSSWLLWQLGAGFGHRGFVELAPIAGVLFALALGGVRSTLQPWLAFLGVLSIYLCTLLMLGYWRALNQANLYWNHLRGEHLSLQANAGLVLACVATWWWLSRWLGAAGSRISVAGDEHA
jgi:hypothetical protein